MVERIKRAMELARQEREGATQAAPSTAARETATGQEAPAAAAVAESAVQSANLGKAREQYVLYVWGDGSRGINATGGHMTQNLCQELMVAAVRAVDGICSGERDARANRSALLADAGVGGSVDEALSGQLKHRLLEGADQHHVAQHRGEQTGISCVPVGFGGRNLDPGHLRDEVDALTHDPKISTDWIQIQALFQEIRAIIGKT
jgi:hypothetical protein